MNSIRWLLLVAVLVTARPARADLIGQSGTVQYDYPCLGCVLEQPVPFTVPDTVVIEQVLQNTITGTGIDITSLSSPMLATVPFSGEVFTFPDFTLSGIVVSQNLDAGVSFDSHHIYINLEGLCLTSASFVNSELPGRWSLNRVAFSCSALESSD